MSVAPGKAVFLSYASQDLEAVKCLCEALRGAGVEVWFDQSELVGGDAWDAKIRRQIGACALFMPIISANTQARLEGYFRLEWKVAAQRTHTMAEELAFLLPVVLDDTRDADARVPAEFKAVQWTRLRAGTRGEIFDAAGLAAFCARVKQLLDGGAVAESAAPVVAAPLPGRAKPPARRISAGHLWAAFGVALAMFYATMPLWRERKPRPPKKEPAVQHAAPAKSAPAASAPAPAAPQLDTRRVVLTRFENLTGDASLDHFARVIETELTRSFAAVQNARVVPLEVSGRTAGRAAAREANAAAVVIGSFLRHGNEIEISAEVVLTAEGDTYGVAGPVLVPAASGRGPGLTELADRLATGVSNVVITLQNPPTRFSAVIYNRPWPRWTMATRVRALRAREDNAERLIATQRELLAEAPELLKVKHDLARTLRDTGRFDEAQKLFRELLRDERGKLSEIEILHVTYDEALLAGDPDRALAAARGLVALQPLTDGISQVISCLWAQNRPRAAWEELSAWWKQHEAQINEASRWSSEASVLATESLMHLMEGHPEQALEVLDRADALVAGRPFAAFVWMRCWALGVLGRTAEQEKLITEVAARSGSGRVEPALLQWSGYCYALHLGDTETARRWLAAVEKSLDASKRNDTLPDHLATLGMWVYALVGRFAEAEALLEGMAQRYPDMISVVGARAMVWRMMGRAEEAAVEEQRLAQWDPRNSRGQPNYWRARLAALAGDRERAVALLRRAIAEGIWLGSFNQPAFEFGRNEPEFAPLRGYAPYEELLRPKG